MPASIPQGATSVPVEGSAAATFAADKARG